MYARGFVDRGEVYRGPTKEEGVVAGQGAGGLYVLATFVAPERNGGKLMLLSFIGVHFYLGNGVDL